ncbi:GNAT family N-acetyltransferase [Photobacterium leiognathi]|uniref:GNAT family N-acetyltransferase n=1 Tax=Photobacterium leiognathi TaxID=553611 RepID=UPI0029824D60|nr:N-acetyltransferase [Photobacterium leiognathi]
MLIRSEAPADILPIDTLLKAVFPSEAEANLVMTLRENGCRTLSLVACNDEGEVVGNAFFSPVTIDGEDHNWQGLAPLAVREDYQGQGIGLALIEEAKSVLGDFGYPAIVVLGEPAYYSKAGFEKALDHQLTCPWPNTEEAFMVCDVFSGAVAQHQGMVKYSPEFDAL